jgi:formylglycine-generating enzyme required for sulfatase activity
MADSDLELLRTHIIEAARNGALGLFVGAGVSKCAGLPLWGELMRETKISEDVAKLPGGDKMTDLAMMADAWVMRCGDRGQLYQRIKDQLRVHETMKLTAKSPVHAALTAMQPSVVLTTNYDDLLHYTFAESRPSVLVGNAAASAWQDLSSDGLPILHLHGHVDHPADMIVTRSDYSTYPQEYRAVCERFSIWMQRRTFLFLGYGAGDSDLDILAEIQRSVHGRLTHKHWALVLGEPDISIEMRYQQLNTRCVFLPIPAGQTHAQALASFLATCTDSSIQIVAQAKRRLDEAAPLAFPSSFQLDLLTPTKLPPAPPKFIGREVPLAELRVVLDSADPKARRVASIVSLRAQGGLGKTTLARHFAHEALKRAQAKAVGESGGPFPDGVLWHRVGIFSYGQSVEDMLRTCGHTTFAELDLSLREAWLRHSLRGKEVLVVLDNVDDVALAPPLLKLLEGHAVLITSRHYVDDSREILLDRMNEEESTQLFGSHAPGTPSAAESAVIRRLVMQQLYGVPLAIVLAAKTLAQHRLTPAQLEARLKEAGLAAIDRRRMKHPDTEAKDVSVEASFLVSWEFVTEHTHRMTFALSAIFGGVDFAVSALRELADRIVKRAEGSLGQLDISDAVDALVAKGLMERVRSDREERVTLWPLLREFAQRELDQRLRCADTPALVPTELPLTSDELQELQIEVLKARLAKGGAEYAVLDFHNLEDLLVKLERPETSELFFGLLLDAAVQNHWWLEGYWEARLQWLQRGEALALRCLDRDADDRVSLVRAADCGIWSVDCLAREGQSEAALSKSLEVQERCERLGSMRNWCFEAYRQTEELFDLGRLDEAWDTLISGLRHSHTHHAQGARAALSRLLANLSIGRCHDDTLVAYYQQCLQVHQASKQDFNALLVMANHVQWLCSQQRWQEAKRMLDQAKLLPGNLGLEGKEWIARLEARFAHDQHDYTTARQLLTSALDHATKTGSLATLGPCHVAWAECLLAEAGHAHAALEASFFDHLKEAESAAAATKDAELQFTCLLLRAEAAMLTAKPGDDVAAVGGYLAEAAELVPSIAYVLPVLRYGLLRARWLWLKKSENTASQWLHWAHEAREASGLKPVELIRLEEPLLQKLPRPAQPLANPPSLRPPIFEHWDYYSRFSEGQILQDADGGPDMVLIPAGFYQLSEPVEDQPLKVWMPAFLIDQCPVTNEEYAEFVAATGAASPTCWTPLAGWGVDGFDPFKERATPYLPEFAHHPVTGITIEDARRYADWRNKLLPNEVEWRAAIQGTDLRPYPWGDSWQPDRLPSVTAPDISDFYSFHPLTEFNEVHFRSLLEGSLSLSLAEKFRVIDALPTLS